MEILKNKYFNYLRFFLKHGIVPMAKLFVVVAPFLSVIAYAKTESLSKSFAVSFVFLVSAFILKTYSNIINAGNDIPILEYRLTKEDEAYGVTANKEDIEEIILYVNDIENWIERKGLTVYRRRPDEPGQS